MSYVDLAVGLGFFLFFLAIVLMISIQHFVQTPAATKVEEYRDAAVNFFNKFFGTEGSPKNWEDTGQAPSELGLRAVLYKIPITVEEKGVAARLNEPVTLKLTFDDECSNKTWNNSLRLYNASLNETRYELVNPVLCSSQDQFLNESYIRFKVNISQSEKKTFYLYFVNDSGIPAPNYTISYSTSSWVPNSGDDWTETTDSVWSRYGGSIGSAETNSTVKMRGSTSIQINGTFDNNKLGLIYNPASAINGVSNGWYLDAWIYVDDLSGLSGVNVSASDGSDEIISSISSGSMANGQWYHFEQNLSSSDWDGWNTFNASNGIDYVTFYMTNSTAGIARSLKVDEVHFEQRPLEIKSFPEEREVVVSKKKVNAMNNLTYDQLRDILGEDYRFRIEITGG